MKLLSSLTMLTIWQQFQLFNLILSNFDYQQELFKQKEFTIKIIKGLMKEYVATPKSNK
ncbi:unnamed protein product [Paramecium sonneborni]|uniref:Uncharacterized protein n=1 Tax=Paramecium sonneborni TaxID=65129 RepID=A0A8S1Q5M8_9CILI|nr:unnamed protein product [Paramecium sonneborni]